MTAGDFTRPGHVMPLRYTEGGVLQRGGHTEAAVDLAVLAGLQPSGYLCEIVDPEDKRGGMARLPQLAKFARTHGLKMITIGASVCLGGAVVRECRARKGGGEGEGEGRGGRQRRGSRVP